MVFPTFSFWSKRDPGDAVGQIDRALYNRNHRVSAGISISDEFDSVRGALVVAQGNGKYLRIRHVVESSLPISPPIREGCLEFVHKRNRDAGQLAQLLADLADVQAALVEKLKCSAGKYVDRVLAVAVSDPGYWETDFDGRNCYWSMCDPARLAELSGVTVIDSFPSRDLAVGGNGRSLEALPLWMMFADRNATIADQTRALLTFSGMNRGYLFPASDGRDAEVPLIESFESIGLGFLDPLLCQSNAIDYLNGENGDSADGNQVSELRHRWVHSADEFNESQFSSEQNGNPALTQLQRLEQRLSGETESYLKRNPDAMHDVIATAICWSVDSIVARLEACYSGRLDQVYVSSDPKLESRIISQVNRSLKDVRVLPAKENGVTHDQFDSVIAALLGLFHIDQMPANVPWLTGADGQRILGRLTPGRPSNWRQLVRVMADFHPAPMKLKDAI